MSATTGQALKWDGTTWAPAADNNTTYTTGTGLSLTGTTFNAQNTTAIWNANQLQSKALDAALSSITTADNGKSPYLGW